MTLDCEIDCLRGTASLVRGVSVSEVEVRRSRLVGEPTLTNFDRKLGAIHARFF